MFDFHSLKYKFNQCVMPSSDNQKNVNAQHRISEGGKTFHKTTVRINKKVCMHSNN